MTHRTHVESEEVLGSERINGDFSARSQIKIDDGGYQGDAFEEKKVIEVRGLENDEK